MRNPGVNAATRRLERRIARAQHLAALLVNQGRCAQLPPGTWAAAEQAHFDATVWTAAFEAAWPAAAVCVDCPVKAVCRQWAAADHYTGIAAGLVFVDGSPHALHHTRYRPAPIHAA